MTSMHITLLSFALMLDNFICLQSLDDFIARNHGGAASIVLT